ncbi:MAG: type II secretion system protein [Phycisphaerales bacterium]|nr:type II secretion system protein [Phycisphaerales bacterium]
MHRRAFTLIELLVVIAVIALLIGILLPALGKARDTGRAVVCISNLAQFSKAVQLYANDWKDRIWPQFDWAPVTYQIQGQPPKMGRGLLYEYVQDANAIGACPTNQRRNLNGTTGPNAWNGATGLNFDYTMLGRVQGFRIGSDVRMAFLSNPSAYAPGTKPPNTLADPAPLTLLTSIPVYIEESIYFNNNGITDGLCGNGDQLEERHFGKGHVAWLDGRAGPMDVSHGHTPSINESSDFDMNDLYARGTKTWCRLEPTDTGNATNWMQRPYGWLNNPEP